MKQLMSGGAAKARERRKDGYSRILLRVGFILLMLGLIAFSIYQLISHMTVGLDTLRTQEITEESYVALDLFVFRDEELITAPGNLCRYHVNDGERVGASSSLATLYTGDGDEETIRALQSLLAVYAQRWALAKNQQGQVTLDDVQTLRDAVDKAYLALLSSADAGRIDQSAEAAERLREGLRKYAVLMGTAEDREDHPATLEAMMDQLVAGYPSHGELTTQRSGYFYYDTDGYELLFGAQNVMTMAPEDFLNLTKEPAQSYVGHVAGKMVYNSAWYAAAYVSLADVAQTAFEVGESYTMICSDGMDTRIDMTVVRMEPTTDGALVVFETDRMPEGFTFPRRFSAQTVTGSTEGYRIPTEALVTLTSSQGKDVTGVYILSGNVVEFRKVHILVSREGYRIVATHDEVQTMMEALPDAEKEAMMADGWSYLKLNDKIITRGTGLYEGKMIS